MTTFFDEVLWRRARRWALTARDGRRRGRLSAVEGALAALQASALWQSGRPWALGAFVAAPTLEDGGLGLGCAGPQPWQRVGASCRAWRTALAADLAAGRRVLVAGLAAALARARWPALVAERLRRALPAGAAFAAGQLGRPFSPSRALRRHVGAPCSAAFFDGSAAVLATRLTGRLGGVRLHDGSLLGVCRHHGRRHYWSLLSRRG